MAKKYWPAMRFGLWSPSKLEILTEYLNLYLLGNILPVYNLSCYVLIVLHLIQHTEQLSTFFWFDMFRLETLAAASSVEGLLSYQLSL